jgi:hypothetical protein
VTGRIGVLIGAVDEGVHAASDAAMAMAHIDRINALLIWRCLSLRPGNKRGERRNGA